MRKYNFADAIDKWFKLGNNLNQRDTIAVRRTVSGLLKLICPAGDYDKTIVRKCLEYALEARRRVKEQLKKIGGMEFYDVHFSYIDLEDNQERFVSVPEQSSGALIPDGRLAPGALHTISLGTSEMPGIYRLEIQTIAGGGKVSASGAAPREPVRVAFDYFKANSSRISASIKPSEHDFHLQLVELQNAGAPQSFTLASFIALCSACLLYTSVAFDEVAGINFKDQDGVQIMKDFMASGSFSRGREAISANAAMVFVGNLPQGQTVESLVKTSHLFRPFPEVMIDSCLLYTSRCV